jgi:hypothetical protein
MLLNEFESLQRGIDNYMEFFPGAVITKKHTADIGRVIDRSVNFREVRSIGEISRGRFIGRSLAHFVDDHVNHTQLWVPNRQRPPKGILKTYAKTRAEALPVVAAYINASSPIESKAAEEQPDYKEISKILADMDIDVPAPLEEISFAKAFAESQAVQFFSSQL